MMRATAILVLAAMSGAGHASGETIPLTLAQAIEQARVHDPNLKRLASLEAAAVAGESEARAGRRPSVALQAGYARLSDVLELGIPVAGGGTRTLVPNVPDNWRTRIESSVPLYTGGRLTAAGEAAAATRDAAAAGVAVGDADLVLETTEAYWLLATTRERTRVLREGLVAYDQHLADARNREAQGLVPRSDVLLVGVDRDRAELALARAASSSAIAEEDLRRITGIATGGEIEVSDRLDAATASEEAIEELVARALERRRERAVLAARRTALEAAARVEDAARLPQLGASATLAYARPNRLLFPIEDSWKSNWDISLLASFQVYDGGQARSAATRRRAEADAVARQLDDLDGRIRLEVVARHRELRTALDAVIVAERAVEAATEARRIVRDRYLEGVSTNGDYLDAEDAWLQAGLDRTSALVQARIAEARLERAVGR